MSQECNNKEAQSTTNKKTNGPGAPKGNFNAWKSGVHSSRKGLILICRTCVAKSKCPKYSENEPNQPCYFERFEAPDLSDMSKLCDFLRELIGLDYSRYRRGLNFEILSGGVMDMDVTRLSQNIQRAIYTLGRLTELSELEKRVEALEAKIEGGVRQ
jgi:hypothetical protein